MCWTRRGGDNAMRRRKWLYFLFLALLIALAVGYVVFLLPGAPDVNLMAKFEQVEIGMTLDELKAKLGTPTRIGRLVTPKPNKPAGAATWEVGDTVLRVTLDDKLQVTTKTCGPKSIGRKLDDLFSRVFP